MKKLISKFIQLTCMLGTLSIPVLGHANDQALIQGQLLSEVQSSERGLVDALPTDGSGQKYTVQPQVVVQKNQPSYQLGPCTLEQLKLNECLETKDNCLVDYLVLRDCEDAHSEN